MTRPTFARRLRRGRDGLLELGPAAKAWLHHAAWRREQRARGVRIDPGVRVNPPWLDRITIGAGSHLASQTILDVQDAPNPGGLLTGGRVRIGTQTFVGPQCHIGAGGSEIVIGHGCLIGHMVTLIGSNHVVGEGRIRDLGWDQSKAGVRIDDGAWIAAGAIVLPGVHIGEGAIVAAGAVVTHDVEAGTIVAGVPARAIRRRDAR